MPRAIRKIALQKVYKEQLMTILYNVAIRGYSFLITCFSFFNAKAKSWKKGRKGWRENLFNFKQKANENPIVWIHCASLGEFEQGRPIIEAIKLKYPNTQVVLTFFSPSGFEVRKNYKLADYVAYLPLDTRSNAHFWVNTLQPDLVVFVKYEFWYHFLNTLHGNKIPILLVSARFSANQPFFKWYGGFFRSILKCYDHLFVQDENSHQLLTTLQISSVSQVGDTRIDRVASLAQKASNFERIEAFKGDDPVFIIGSNWPEDDALLIPFINEHLPGNWKCIMAPHEIKPHKLTKLTQGLKKKCSLYSQYEGETTEVLIIDNVGMLNQLYQYGSIAYIGGAFGKGLHNILEPMAFGLPVLFGPKYLKFEEAVTIIKAGGGKSVNQIEELKESFRWLLSHYEDASNASKVFIERNVGATSAILTYISKSNFLLQEKNPPG